MPAHPDINAAAPDGARRDHHVYIFGDYAVDVERGALLNQGREIPLRRQSFRVLSYLVARYGQLVGKDEIMREVWGDVVVTEGSLSQCLGDIRRAIGDDDHRVIRTVPRCGYRFDMPVTERTQLPATVSRADDGSSIEESGAAPSARPPHGAVSVASRARSQRSWLALALLVMAAGAAVWLLDRRSAQEPPPPVASDRSIAVLPFVDLSPGGDHGYFADGMTEELINLLAQVPELLVIARTSSFYFKDRRVDVKSIGRQLNVSYLLEGSVRTAGERVRVTAQLVRTSDGSHVWSSSFDRELGDALTVQDAIAGAVARELHVEFRLATPARPPDPEAYRHFLQAQYLFNRRKDGDIPLAESYFRKAVELDPEFGRAWAGLAGTYLIWFHDFDLPKETGMPLMRDAVEHALAASPELADVQMRAANYFWHAGDYETALEHRRRALALEPTHPLVLHARAHRATLQGDIAAAADLVRQAVDRDPMSWVGRGNLINLLLGLGRLDEARSLIAEGMTLHGTDMKGISTHQAMLALAEGRFDDALAHVEDVAPGVQRETMLAMAYDGVGRAADADRILADLESAPDPESALAVSEVYAQRGDLEAAWHWLEVCRRRYEDRPVAQRSGFLHRSSRSWALAPLRSEPRWAAMIDEYRQPLRGVFLL